MRRPLIVGHRVYHLQAIESSSLRVAVRTSACIVAPLDRPQPLNHRGLELLLISSVSTDRLQAIESSSSRVVAERSRGIGASSRYAIGSSLRGRATLVIELLSECI